MPTPLPAPKQPAQVEGTPAPAQEAIDLTITDLQESPNSVELDKLPPLDYRGTLPANFVYLETSISKPRPKGGNGNDKQTGEEEEAGDTKEVDIIDKYIFFPIAVL